ncbi:protein FAM83C [Denticeps clupeoides]|uniref:Scaffolding anchor of CK1 domain-containing protein n=1 Tax=Denticeps clupeoides TaxID=299321 RepID=A0AAY4ES34_9TELE|nr:protein FAM83C [Denticeps clupeoides]
MSVSEALWPTPVPARKPLGKLATRLEELKSPWRQVSALELSHNEAARLATDALLESGEKEYRRVLTEERELSFLSPLEIRYITEHANRSCPDEAAPNGAERDFGDGDAASELTSGTYFPMMSDEEPPVLELGWPELPPRFGPSETQIFFQRDKTQNVKDLIRSLINKAKKVIALVMDIFTDVDLFCDLMEASNKRKVPVYVLLDEKNLSAFLDMCNALDVQNSHLSNMRIRSVCGDTYCTKSGKKFTGQVQEKFMIIDCEEVVAGSYSFTWLSAQVHTNMLLHFSGRITESFDREFRCLYADSQIIDHFYNPDDEHLPYVPYPPVFGSVNNIGQDFLKDRGPPAGLDFMQDRGNRDRFSSENSSSQSSSSISSIKAAPGMSSPTQKFPQDKPEATKPLKGAGIGSTSPVQSGHGIRGSPNGSNLSPMQDHTPGVEWARAGTPEFLRANLGGPTSKLQAMALYDHKSAYNKSPPPQPMENKFGSKQRSPTNPFFNKFTDFFSTTKQEKDPFGFKRPPGQNTAFGGPDLSQNEPESTQVLPVPTPLPKEAHGNSHWLNRRDEKRMTLGHSKLDLVNQYNKLKSKQVYSRFELKNNN